MTTTAIHALRNVGNMRDLNASFAHLQRGGVCTSVRLPGLGEQG